VLPVPPSLCLRLLQSRAVAILLVAAALPATVAALATPGRAVNTPTCLGWTHDNVSAELREIVKADQEDRANWQSLTPEDAKRMRERDAERRGRVREMLDKDQLTQLEDFENAALVFQHGDVPEDYETARELALLAWMKGDPNSLVALAEDRFLQKIGRTQRFGGQFTLGPDGKITLGAVEEGEATSVTDELRLDFLLPPLEPARERGFEAVQEYYDKAVERLKERTDPEWIQKAAESEPSKELRKLYEDNLDKPFDDALRSRVLEIYNAGNLLVPDDYYRVASILSRGSLPGDLILANELAAAASARKHKDAPRLFAETSDAFLRAIGREPRYGTEAGGKPTASVAPAVRRALGLD
jgi:hypothetical protein